MQRKLVALHLLPRLGSGSSHAVISHLCWSAANVAVQAVAYLLLDVESFAFVSLVILATTQAGQLGRAMGLEPGLRGHRVEVVYIGVARWVSFGCALAVLGLLRWLVVDLSSTEMAAGLFSVVAVVRYDLRRSVLLLSLHYSHAARTDFAWMSLALTASSILYLFGLARADLLLVGWSSSALVASFGAQALRSSIVRSSGRVDVRTVLSFGFDYFSVAGATQLLILAASTSNLESVALLRAAQLLVAPLNLAVSGLRSFAFQSVQGGGRSSGGLATSAGRVSGAAFVVAAIVYFEAPTTIWTVGLILAMQRILVLVGLVVSAVLRAEGRIGLVTVARVIAVCAMAAGFMLNPSGSASYLALMLCLNAFSFVAARATVGAVARSQGHHVE